MAQILIKAASFIAIIFLGYLLRKKGFFKQEDFHVLAKIVLKITLPAAIISNFSGVTLNPSMLLLAAAGLGLGILYMILGRLVMAGKSRKDQAFGILNTSGYNIGNFTMPFAQSFLGPMGVVTTSLFDTGNAFVCLGGAYSVASAVQDGNGKLSFLPIFRTLIKSVPFDSYILMTVLSLLGLSLPSPVLTFAEIIGGANAFLAMLMIGVGFHLSGSRSQVWDIVKILAVRYGVAVLFACIFFLTLPIPLEYRQALAVLVFSPIASAAPSFTADLDGDFGLASAVNSISIVISICLITLTLLIVL